MSENSIRKYTEAELITAIQKGSHQALDALYDKYAPVFLGIISRIVEDEKTADDVLMESFVEIGSKIRNYDISKGYFFAWMMSIVRTRAIEINKARKSDTLNESVNSGEKVAIADILPESQQVFEPKALKLVMFKGYCYEEVAEELGVLSESIKSRVRLEFKELRVK